MLERLLQVLESKGLPEHGRGKLISSATGIDASSVSRVLNGKQKISRAFLKSVCTTYGINEEWVKTGGGEMFAQMLHTDLMSSATTISGAQFEPVQITAALDKSLLLTALKSVDRLVKDMPLTDEKKVDLIEQYYEDLYEAKYNDKNSEEK
jgi:transcriptional regulator with XRE-family HTH domain